MGQYPFHCRWEDCRCWSFPKLDWSRDWRNQIVDSHQKLHLDLLLLCKRLDPRSGELLGLPVPNKDAFDSFWIYFPSFSCWDVHKGGIDPKTRRFVRSGFALCQICYSVDLIAFDGTQFTCILHMLLPPPRTLLEDLWRGLGSSRLLQLFGSHVPRLHFVWNNEVRLIRVLYLSLIAIREKLCCCIHHRCRFAVHGQSCWFHFGAMWRML